MDRVIGFLAGSDEELEAAGWVRPVPAERPAVNPFSGVPVVLKGWKSPDPSRSSASEQKVPVIRLDGTLLEILPSEMRPKPFVDENSAETLLHRGMLDELCALVQEDDQHGETFPPDWVSAPTEEKALRALPEDVVDEITAADDEELVALARRWADSGWFCRFYTPASEEQCAAGAYALLKRMQDVFSGVDVDAKTVYMVTGGYVHPG